MHIDRAAQDVPAAVELLRFIRENYGTVPAFCEASGLDRIKTQKAIKGTFRKMDVEFALDVERATEGLVKAVGWRRDADGVAPEGRATAVGSSKARSPRDGHRHAHLREKRARSRLEGNKR